MKVETTKVKVTRCLSPSTKISEVEIIFFDEVELREYVEHVD